MPVTSVLIECVPGRSDEVATMVATLPAAELHNRMENFMVVVTSTRTRNADEDLLREMGHLPGVIAATPVFTNCEDLNIDLLQQEAVAAAGWEV